MDKKDLFRVFDACQPTVAQVREYLERISGNSPFDLIFVDDGKEKITRNLNYNMGSLLGVVIESTVFYTQIMSKEDNNDDRDLTADDIFAFGRKIHPKARPLSKADVLLLGRYKKEYETLGDMLKVFGYSNLPPLQNYYLLLKKAGNYTFADDINLLGYNEGNTNIAHFLHFRNIMFCAGWQVKI